MVFFFPILDAGKIEFKEKVNNKTCLGIKVIANVNHINRQLRVFMLHTVIINEYLLIDFKYLQYHNE